MPTLTRPAAQDESEVFLNQAKSIGAIYKKKAKEQKALDEKIFGLIAKSRQAEENLDELYGCFLLAFEKYEAADKLKESKESKRPSAQG